MERRVKPRPGRSMASSAVSEPRKKKGARKKPRYKPPPVSFASVQEALREFIREQGHEDTPTGYMMCLLTLLETRTEASLLPQFLGLLKQCIPSVPTETLRGTQERVVRVLTHLLARFADQPRCGAKVLRCLRCLYVSLEPTERVLDLLEKVRPDRANVQLVPYYNKALTSVYTNLSPKILYPRLPLLINRWHDQLTNEAPESVAKSAAHELGNVLAVCVTDEMFDNAEAVTSVVSFTLPLLQQPAFKENWDLAADVFAILFIKFKRRSYPLLVPALQQLDAIRSTGDFHYNIKAERAIGRALRAMGPEHFLSVIPYDPDPDVNKRGYLGSILRKYTSHATLHFFQQHFIPMADRCRELSQKSEREQNALGQKLWLERMEQVWAFLPGFCTFPSDITDTTYIPIAKAITVCLKQYPSLRSTVCQALQLLVEKNKWLADLPEGGVGGEDDDGEGSDDGSETEATSTTATSDVMRSDRGAGVDALDDTEEESLNPHAYHGITRAQAKLNVQVLGRVSKNVLPVLCNVFEHMDPGARGFMLDTIRSYASIAPPDVLNNVFRIVGTHLLSALDTQMQQAAAESAKTPEKGPDGLDTSNRKARKAKRQQKKAARIAPTQFTSTAYVMADVAAALCGVLDDTNMQHLLRLLPTLLAPTQEPMMQKKGYKLLNKLLLKEDVVNRNIEKITQVMLCLRDSQQCHTMAKKHRMKCFLRLFHIMYTHHRATLKSMSDMFAEQVLSGVLDGNGNTREASFNLLRVVANQMAEDNGGPANFVEGVLNGLKSTSSPQAACRIIVVLGRLYMESVTELPLTLHESMLAAVLSKMKDDDTTVRNCSINYLRVVLKAGKIYPPALDVVRNVLPTIAEAVVSWTQGGRAAGARKRMHVLVERLIKRLGLEAVTTAFPEAHRRYVRYVERERRKQRRRKAHADGEGADTLKDKSLAGEFHKAFYQEDKKVERKRGAVVGPRALLRASGDEPEDLTDPSFVKRFVTTGGGRMDEDDDNEEDYGPFAFEEGRLAWQPAPGSVEAKSGGVLSAKGNAGGPPMNRQVERALHGGEAAVGGKRKRDRDDSDDDEPARSRKRAPPTGWTQPVPRLREDPNFVSGEKFRAARAGGDMKKGSLEPFAYVPLSRAYLNRRFSAHSARRFSSVMPKSKISGKKSSVKKKGSHR